MMAIFNRDSEAAQGALKRAAAAAWTLTTSGHAAKARLDVGLREAQAAHSHYVNSPWRLRLCWMSNCPNISKISEDIKAMEAASEFLENWTSKTSEVCTPGTNSLPSLIFAQSLRLFLEEQFVVWNCLL